MESQAEKNARLKARVDDFKISLFNATGGAMGYVAVLGDMSRDVGNLIPLFSGFAKMLAFVTNAEKMQALWTGIVTAATSGWTAVQWALNAAMTANPIGIVIVAIGALVGLIALAWNKMEGFRRVVFKGWEALKLLGNVIRDFVIDRIKGIISGFSGLTKAFMEFVNGDWRKALETGKKAAVDLMGFKAGKNAANKFKDGWAGAMDKGSLASDAYTAGRQNKISEAGLPGQQVAGTTGTVGTGATGELDKTNKATATGGSKHNYITISLNSLIEVLNIKGNDFRENSKQLQEQSTDALLRTLALATTAGS